MSVINDVKNKIKEKLDTLNPTYLKYVEISDIKRDPLDQELQSFPACFIMPPAIGTVQRLDNRSIIRELTFTIMTILKQDDIVNTQQVEDLMQAMMDVIDNSITFDNVAVGGVVPTSSFPEPYIHSSKTYVVFDIIIKARVVQNLSFS